MFWKKNDSAKTTTAEATQSVDAVDHVVVADAEVEVACAEPSAVVLADIEGSREHEKDASRETVVEVSEAERRPNRDPVKGLGEVLLVLAKDPQFRGVALETAHHLVAGAIVANKALVARLRRQTDGAVIPVAVALWAAVSDAVDADLSERKVNGMPAALEPSHWHSGKNFWLVAVAGPKASRRVLVEQLKRRSFVGIAWKQFYDV